MATSRPRRFPRPSTRFSVCSPRTIAWGRCCFRPWMYCRCRTFRRTPKSASSEPSGYGCLLYTSWRRSRRPYAFAGPALRFVLEACFPDYSDRRFAWWVLRFLFCSRARQKSQYYQRQTVYAAASQLPTSDGAHPIRSFAANPRPSSAIPRRAAEGRSS